MAFHHKVKPHHHFGIWVLVGLAILIAGLVYNTASLDRVAADQGPSEKTKRFFGFNESDEGRDWVMPEACKMQAEQDRMQQLSTEMQSLSNQVNTLSQQSQDPNLTEEQRQANQQQIQQLQQKMAQLQAEMEQLNKTFQGGPSDECKVAMVNQAVAMMQDMLVKMDSRFPSTLAKVENVVTKIENVLPGLTAAGLPSDQVEKIKADISSIKLQLSILRSFFEKMKSSMQQFINEAKASPLKAFEKMQTGSLGMDDTQSNRAANAADTMVKNFEELVDILDKIQKADEGQ